MIDEIKKLRENLDELKDSHLKLEENSLSLLNNVMKISKNLLHVKFMVDCISSLLDDDDKVRVMKLHEKLCADNMAEELEIIRKFKEGLI